MIATPTTTVDVLRGTTTNEFDDVLDANTPAPGLTGIPASITERSQKVHEPKNSEDRIVRNFKGRLPYGTALLKGDRLRDRATGTVYVVDNLYQRPKLFARHDLAVDLSLTT